MTPKIIRADDGSLWLCNNDGTPIVRGNMKVTAVYEGKVDLLVKFEGVDVDQSCFPIAVS